MLAVCAVALLRCGGATRSNGSGGAAGAAGNTTSTGSGGSGAGGGGAAGTDAGVLADICKLPEVVGPCDAAFPAWWHDPSTGVCEPFVYGGCQGNANNFPTLEACQSACRGGQPDMDACGGPGECVFASGAGCCGGCEPVDARSFVAINRASVQTYSDIKRCNVSCGACPPVTEPERTSQYFIAVCQAGQCTVSDVRQTDLTICSNKEDCVLRDGAQCCEGCDGQGIVSLNRSADLSALVCSVSPSGCPPCVPVIPAGYTPMCIDGRCTVGFLR